MATEQPPPSGPAPPAKASPSSADSTYAALESYPWHTDREFQSGLQAILGPSSGDPAQAQDLTLRARCFYYARKYNANVDFLAYKAWRGRQAAYTLSPLEPVTLAPPSVDSNPSSAENTPSKPGFGGGVNGAVAASGGVVGGEGADGQTQQMNSEQTEDQGQPTYPPSFATIMELIKNGQPIPGIKDIPDTVLADKATEATKSRRRKPWEERQGRDDADNVGSTGGGGAYGGYFGAPTSGQESFPSGLFSTIGEAPKS